jgi:dUTP pyrophosphatase
MQAITEEFREDNYRSVVKLNDLEPSGKDLQLLVKSDNRSFTEINTWLEKLNSLELLKPKIFKGLSAAYGRGHGKGRRMIDAMLSSASYEMRSSYDTIYGESLVNDYANEPTFTSSIPTRMATNRSAGHEIYAIKETLIPARGRTSVETELSINIPNGYYCQIQPRSGLAFRHGIVALSGVIDSDFHSNMSVLLFNHSDTSYTVKAGDSIAQLILLKYYLFDGVTFMETDVEHVGFGSSDKK